MNWMCKCWQYIYTYQTLNLNALHLKPFKLKLKHRVLLFAHTIQMFEERAPKYNNLQNFQWYYARLEL